MERPLDRQSFQPRSGHLELSTSGSVENALEVTGSGEHQYEVSRHAEFEKDEALKSLTPPQ